MTKDKLTAEEKLIKEKRELMFKYVNKLQTDDPNKSIYNNKSTMASLFDIDDVVKFMRNPKRHEKQLRQLSNFLYDISPQYRLIVRHVATMPTYAYVVDPLSVIEDTTDLVAYKKSYLKVLQQIEKMSIRHEMSKAMKTAYKEDTFYGYEHETKDSFFIQKMDADYCKITSVEDGVFNYSFDFSYFDGRKELLDAFPDEFKHLYQQYQATKLKWIELDSLKSFAFKVNDDIPEYSLPPYSTIFESIFDLDEYKRIKKARTKMDNFMTLVQTIPINDDSQDIDSFRVSLELAMQFHTAASASLPSGIGLITSPLPIEAVRLEKNKNDADTVAEATREVFNDSGLSQFLFNSDKNTSMGVNKSILSDEQMAFNMLRQVERWLNRKIKNYSGRFKFQIRLLDISTFSANEAYEKFLKAAQFGIPVKQEIAAALGISPLDLHNKLFLENDILKLHERMIPLASSHTQTGDEGKAGRPSVGDDASESTIAWRETEQGTGEH